MQLAVILPGNYTPEHCELRENYLKSFVSDATEIKVFTAGGTKSITSIVDFTLMAPGMTRRALEAERAGFDGVLIFLMLDYGIEAARAAVTIPVVGEGSATYHLAYQLADRIGVITCNERTVPEYMRRMKAMGCYDRVTSLRPINIPILEMVERKDELEHHFLETARHQINEEGAQLIVAGATSILPSLGVGFRERMEQELNIPLLEGPATSIKTLEMVVQLRLAHSKKAYPSPAE
jgi:allantoin racemase